MTAPRVPADHETWRQDRWEEVFGVSGKAKVVANARITGPGPHALPGIPGQWRTTGAGELTVTAQAADGVRVAGHLVDGTSPVAPGGSVEFPGDRVGFVGGADGSYGLVVLDHGRLDRTGLTGIDTFPHDPARVFRGRYRAAPEGRRIEVPRLTSPRSTDAIPAPVDLVVTVDGAEHVLAVLEDLPGRRLVIFTDETNGDSTPAIGRWLLLPPLEPGRTLAVDFNRAVLSYHHLNPDVFTCPLAPPGNHLPMRVEAGERALIGQDPKEQDLKGKAATYLRALQDRDWKTARALCARTATVWHNDGKGEQSIEDNIAGMRARVGSIASMRYDILRQLSRPGEVLQQHVVHVATANGTRGQVHAAVYFGFDDTGRIERIEEYANFIPADDQDG